LHDLARLSPVLPISALLSRVNKEPAQSFYRIAFRQDEQFLHFLIDPEELLSRSFFTNRSRRFFVLKLADATNERQEKLMRRHLVIPSYSGLSTRLLWNET